MPANYGQNQGPVGGITPPMPSVSAPRGQLRGDLSLQGGIAPRPKVTGGDSAVVQDAQMVVGQEADAKLGIFLNFNSVEKPQPIRGDLGATDPGPRTSPYPFGQYSVSSVGHADKVLLHILQAPTSTRGSTRTFTRLHPQTRATCPSRCGP